MFGEGTGCPEDDQPKTNDVESEKRDRFGTSGKDLHEEVSTNETIFESKESEKRVEAGVRKDTKIDRLKMNEEFSIDQ